MKQGRKAQCLVINCLFIFPYYCHYLFFNNTYVYAVKFDIVITTSSTGTPTVASERKIIVRNNPPGQETWNVVPAAITISAAPYLTFQVSSVTSSSTVKWIGNLELTVVT